MVLQQPAPSQNLQKELLELNRHAMSSWCQRNPKRRHHQGFQLNPKMNRQYYCYKGIALGHHKNLLIARGGDEVGVEPLMYD